MHTYTYNMYYHVCVRTYIIYAYEECIHIYIYIYIERERENEPWGTPVQTDGHTD